MSGLLGKIAKGVGYLANEIIKEATGIDIGKEISPVVEGLEESKRMNNDVKLFKKNKEAFVEKYGIEQYEAELELLELDLQMFNEETKELIYDKQDELRDSFSEKCETQEKLRYIQEKVRRMPDKQLIRVCERTDLSLGVRNLIQQERVSRGI